MENIGELLKTYINQEEFNKILITSHSTRIEGSTLSFEEAVELIQKGNTPGGKHISFSHLTLDHHNALNFVLEEAKKRQRIVRKVYPRDRPLNIIGKTKCKENFGYGFQFLIGKYHKI